MNSDVRSVLHRAASKPQSAVNYDAIARAALAKRRHRRELQFAALGLSVLTAAAGISTLGWWGGDETGAVQPDGVAPAATTTKNRVVPVGSTSNGRWSTTVTLVDGSKIELSAPASLGLEKLAAFPQAGLEVPDVAARDIVVPADGLAWFARIATKQRDILVAQDRSVSLWTVSDPNGPSRYLVFQAGGWVFGVWDGAGGAQMSDTDLSLWARSLLASTTPDGYLVIRTVPPLQLMNGEISAAPALELSDGADVSLMLSAASCDLDLVTATPSGEQVSASICHPDWEATVLISGPKALVDGLIDGLSVRRTSAG